jgi:hypothetical protein
MIFAKDFLEKISSYSLDFKENRLTLTYFEHNFLHVANTQQVFRKILIFSLTCSQIWLNTSCGG